MLQTTRQLTPNVDLAATFGSFSDLFSGLSSLERYLGESSGMSFIRSALDLARTEGLLDTSYQPELTTAPADAHLHHIVGRLEQTDSGMTPDRSDAEALFTLFEKTQMQYDVLNQDEFRSALSVYYAPVESRLIHATATVEMVFAIAMYMYGRNEGSPSIVKRGESYNEKVLANLSHILLAKTLDSMRVLLLILQYSLASPQQPVVWHCLGYAIRLATMLGLHKDDQVEEVHPWEVRLRRRLFWSLYSIDRAVGNTLGRSVYPNSTSTSLRADFKLPRPSSIQDLHITVDLPSLPPNATMEETITNHCFRIRRLQSEVADVMYQRVAPYSSAFVADLQGRLDQWLRDVPTDNVPRATTVWMRHAYFNLQMFLHRPSVANPVPSIQDLSKCFAAASEVLKLYTMLHKSGNIDCTWMAAHWLFLAAITHLFCIWSSEDIRNSLDWTLVIEDTQAASMVFAAIAERLRSAREMPWLYHSLCSNTFKRFGEIYVNSEEESHVEDNTIM